MDVSPELAMGSLLKIYGDTLREEQKAKEASEVHDKEVAEKLNADHEEKQAALVNMKCSNCEHEYKGGTHLCPNCECNEGIPV